MRPKPYIGITGFMSRGEIELALAVLPRGTDQLVMVGVLASSKTLRGIPNRWLHRYPLMAELAGIFPAGRNTLNLIHFNTKDRESLFVDMCHVQALAGSYCHGFQLNIVWPDKGTLTRYRDHAPRGRNTIVLQCGEKALEEIDRTPAKLVKRVREYEGLIDYVLIDPSGGLGLEFDEMFAHNCLFALSRDGPESIGVGIAGGLHADNIARLHGLLGAFEFSIDAEGRLRDKDDNLNIAAAQAYLQAADALYKYHGR